MKTISRSEAKSRGLKRYFTGKACHRGHVAERFVSVYSCVICQSENGKDWENKNPVRAKEGQRARQARRRPRTEYINRTKAVRTAKGRAWYAQNKEERKATVRLWQAANPESLRSIKHRYRAKVGAGGSHSAEDIKLLMKRQKSKCAHDWCRTSLKSKYHVDHIVPIALGGSNVKTNIQLLCPSCNSRKWAKHPVDFAQQNGRLL